MGSSGIVPSRSGIRWDFATLVDQTGLHLGRLPGFLRQTSLTWRVWFLLRPAATQTVINAGHGYRQSRCRASYALSLSTEMDVGPDFADPCVDLIYET